MTHTIYNHPGSNILLVYLRGNGQNEPAIYLEKCQAKGWNYISPDDSRIKEQGIVSTYTTQEEITMLNNLMPDTTEKLFLVGFSAGKQAVDQFAWQLRRLKIEPSAFVGLSGASNLVDHYNLQAPIVKRALEKTYGTVKNLLKYSSLHLVQVHDLIPFKPYFLAHGSIDQSIPFEQATNLHEELVERLTISKDYGVYFGSYGHNPTTPANAVFEFLEQL